MPPESATKSLTYLGFRIDTASFTISAEPDKLEAIRDMCSFLHEKSRWPVKHWASLRSKIASLLPVFGPLVLITSPPVAIAIDNHVNKYGWKNCVYLACNSDILYGLRIPLANLSDWNGITIPTPANGVSLSFCKETIT